MTTLTDAEFDAMISRAMDELPKRDIENLSNVVVTYADEPDRHQAGKIQMRGDSLLLGLYEGIPLTQRGMDYNLVLPDKITLFKIPILKFAAIQESDVFEQVKRTLWHEIAHFYGLDHSDIRSKEGTAKG